MFLSVCLLTFSRDNSRDVSLPSQKKSPYRYLPRTFFPDNCTSEHSPGTCNSLRKFPRQFPQLPVERHAPWVAGYFIHSIWFTKYWLLWPRQVLSRLWPQSNGWKRRFLICQSGLRDCYCMFVCCFCLSSVISVRSVCQVPSSTGYTPSWQPNKCLWRFSQFCACRV